MATIYVRSTDGNDSDNGSTWALAKATLAGALAIDAAGDTIYLSQSHAETFTSFKNLTGAGTIAAPSKLICANDGAEPPTTLATGASFTTSGASVLVLFSLGDSGYAYGISFILGSGSEAATLTLGGANLLQVYESCTFNMAGTGSTIITLSSGVLRNCNFIATATGQYIKTPTGGRTFIDGGSWASSTATPTFLFEGTAALFEVNGIDFSALGTGFDMVKFPSGSNGKAVFRNCKLPASWAGALINSASASIQARAELYNCDSTDTNYRLWVEDPAGSIKHDSGVYNNAGATDGATRISWKMVSGANAEYPVPTLRSPEIVKWNETTTGTLTASVEVVFDGATDLNNDEIWLEVQYLGTSGYPLGSFVTDCKANVLASAAAQANGSATWTGTSGFTNENKHTLSVSFDPKEKGYIHAVVCLAKASTTVYVDPLLTVA